MTPENRILHALGKLNGPEDSIGKVEQLFFISEIACAGRIWRVKEQDALQVLYKKMESMDRAVSMAAGQTVASIARRGDEQVSREVRALMVHELEHIRLSALTAFVGSSAHGDPAVVEAIAAMLQDASLRIRRRAVLALPSMAPTGHPMLLRSICVHINHPEPYVRSAACRALGKVSDPSDETALKLLREALSRDQDISVRTQALSEPF